jgi:hypothetical protein
VLMLQTLIWPLTIFNLGNPDDICSQFLQALSSIFVNHIPHVDKVVKPSDMPWFNTTIKKAINKRKVI